MSPAQQEHQTPIKYWLIAVAAVAIGAWLIWRSQATSHSESTAIPHASGIVELPNTRGRDSTSASTSSKLADAPLPTVPISARSTTGDLSMGVEPGSVGWTSEAFNESSIAQLKRFAKLIAGPESIDASQVSRLISDDFRCNSLRPSDLSLVHDGSAAKVRRWPGSPDEPLSKGLADLAEIAGELPRLSSPEHHIGVKNVRVVLGDHVSTEVRASGIGMKLDKLAEWTATWQCEWETSDTANPRISSLRVVEYEEVSTAHTKPFLTDRTFEVMADADGYSDQLLVGMNSWVNRLERRLRVNRLGHNGIAVGDVNGDGRDDVYVCQSGGLPNRLYVQQGDGSVKDNSALAGVDFLDDTTCALLVDLDNDGDQDAALATNAGVKVFENQGQARFVLRFECELADSDLQGISAVDFDNDGDLDLYQLVDYASDDSRTRAGLPSFVYHNANDGGSNRLFRNDIRDGSWSFEDITDRIGLDVNNHRHSLAAAWDDYDRDGDQDLYVANDYGQNCLYRNDGGQFTEVAAVVGVTDFGSGMSVAWGDYDRDQQSDLYVSNMFSSAGNRITNQSQFLPKLSSERKQLYSRFAKGNSLFRNVGNGGFEETGQQLDVETARWAWGSLFADYNNDGWEDILVANGYITTRDTGDL